MILNYFNTAWINLKKHKVFTAINIIGLSTGFSCGILIFLFINYHLKFDDFHKNSDRIYRLVTEEHHDNIDYTPSVPPGFANVFKSDYAYHELIAKIVSQNSEQVSNQNTQTVQHFREDIVFSEPDFFKIFNFPLLELNGNRSLEEPNTAYITEAFSSRVFGKENALGKTFVYKNKEQIQVIGILKDLPKTSVIKGGAFISFKTLKSYNGFLSSETWGGTGRALQCFTLLKENQNIGHIEKSLENLVSKYRSKSKNIHHYKLQALNSIHFDNDYGGMNKNLLWIFSIIGIVIIAIGCINFINISTAQASTRSKEIGVRKVLGSLKSHLFWQFLTETFIIASIAMLIALLITILVLPSFNQFFEINLSINNLYKLKVIGFISFLLFIVSFFAGSYPGILLARVSPILALKGKLINNDNGGQVTRKVLVTVQFAVSIILIASVLIIEKQIRYATNTDLGFDKEAMVMLKIPEEVGEMKLENLKQRINNLSGVKRSTACLTSPGAGKSDWSSAIKYNNRPTPEEFSISAKLGDKDYIEVFNLKLVAGRNFFLRNDNSEVVVNEKLATKLGLSSSEELLGKQIQISGGNYKATIVGVVADFHHQDFHNEINPIFIIPDAEDYQELAVKVNVENMGATLLEIENLWKQVFTKNIFEYDFLDDRVALQYKEEQQFLTMSKLFSGLAIIISCLGLYGMISFFVERRKKEIGIRKVLGGKISDILFILTQEFFKLIVLASLIAIPLAWYFMNNWLEGYQFRIIISWWIFAIAIASVLIITLLTISKQAIKAASVNPIKSLRTE